MATRTFSIEVDAELESRALRSLRRRGITLEDAVMSLITHAAEDEAVREEAADHDAWLRAAIEEAMEDDSVGIPHDVIEDEWARERATLLARTR